MSKTNGHLKFQISSQVKPGLKKSLKKILSDKNFLNLLYKLLHDTLFLFLFSFTLILIAEGLLPGIITSHLGLSKLAAGLVGTITLIVWLGRKLELTYAKSDLSKSKLLPILITFSFLLIGNSLLRFALWENIILTVSTLFVFILFYLLLFSNEK